MENNSKIILNNENNESSNSSNTNNILSILNKRLNNVKSTEITNNINETKSIKKIRNPSIDLIRIICMFGIINTNILFHGKGFKKYIQYENRLNLLYVLLFWHINGFGLISGIVGYKTNKYSNLFYLWFRVFFYTIVIYLYYHRKDPFSIICKNILNELFVVILSKYWYFTAYFGMYLFLPIINKGIQNLTKVEFKLLLLSMHGIFVFWSHVKNPNSDAFKLRKGNSVLWFLVLYITGGYIGKYKIDCKGIKKFIYCLICIIIFIISTLWNYYLPKYSIDKVKGYFIKKLILILKLLSCDVNNSFPKILQTISLSLFLLQIKYNKYISKIISFFGPLTFGVYLIHDNHYIRSNQIANIFKKEPNNLSVISTLGLVCNKSLKIFIICSFIDYIRHIIFTICRIRKICIFIENNTFKIFE